MKGLFLTGAVVAAALSTWAWVGVGSTHTSHSFSQLTQMADEFTRLGDALTADQRISHELVLAERRRRVLVPVGIGAAALFVAGAIVTRGRSRKAKRTNEEQRLAAAVGDPALTLQGARMKAAALLGVTPDAPAAVIEAALNAQLESRAPHLLEGLAPDLQKMALARREELIRARDLLLRRPPAP
ncbi:MAG: hypothetical protein ACOZIN_01085 [Myxococcota bacterium]